MIISRRKKRKPIVDTLKNKVITTLNLYGEQSSKEIAERINAPQKVVTQLLSSLRRSEIVSRIIFDHKKNIGTWIIKKQKEEPQDIKEKPYPNFDKEHESWIKKEKPKYRQ